MEDAGELLDEMFKELDYVLVSSGRGDESRPGSYTSKGTPQGLSASFGGLEVDAKRPETAHVQPPSFESAPRRKPPQLPELCPYDLREYSASCPNPRTWQPLSPSCSQVSMASTSTQDSIESAGHYYRRIPILRRTGVCLHSEETRTAEQVLADLFRELEQKDREFFGDRWEEVRGNGNYEGIQVVDKEVNNECESETELSEASAGDTGISSNPLDSEDEESVHDELEVTLAAVATGVLLAGVWMIEQKT